jgi:signal transduction histidine kinase
LAHHQTQRLNRLVGDLLDVGRLHGGKLHLVVEPLDVRALGDQVPRLRERSGRAPGCGGARGSRLRQRRDQFSGPHPPR